MIYVLTVNEYSIECILGCYPEEKEQFQEVLASIKIAFQEPPQTIETDLISNTLCYAQLCCEIKRIALEKHFNTIEHLSWEIYRHLQSIIPRECRWYLRLHKVDPPLEGLKNGVSFQIGDLI